MGGVYIPPKDSDKRSTIRVAAATKGWTYLAHPIEFETSLLAACYSKDWENNDHPNITIKFYDASDVEQTTQANIDANAVKTEVHWKPDFDYDLIGGKLYHRDTITTDVRFWVVGGMLELAANTVEFVSGINLRNIDKANPLETDGRASKFMAKVTAGAPYDTNQLKFIVRHPAGEKHKMMIVLEYFRA